MAVVVPKHNLDRPWKASASNTKFFLSPRDEYLHLVVATHYVLVNRQKCCFAFCCYSSSSENGRRVLIQGKGIHLVAEYHSSFVRLMMLMRPLHPSYDIRALLRRPYTRGCAIKIVVGNGVIS